MQGIIYGMVLVSLVVLAESVELRSPRSKRGFRNGAADRFSHGFGKRTPEEMELEKKLGFRQGASDRFSHGFGKRIPEPEMGMDLAEDDKRGFRKGASDRFSHGFGKRTLEGDVEYPATMLSVEEMSDMVAETPALRDALVQRFLDTNRDGFVSRSEVMAVLAAK